MTVRLLPALLIVLMVFSCARPENNAESEILASKWNDDVFRDIHELKNARQTLELTEYLNHPEPQYRAEAAMALGSFNDSSALKPLADALRDESPEVRMMAAFALGQMRNTTAGTHLIELVRRDTTTAVRTEALEAIGKCAGTETAQFLAEYAPSYLFDEAGMAWGTYHLALAKKASQVHAERMAPLLESEYEETRLAAARFFIRYPSDEPWGGLERLLNVAATDPSAEVRLAAARALEFHDLPERADVLEALVVYDQHPGVRVNAIAALNSMAGIVDHEIVWQAVFDGNPNVSLAAARFFADQLQEKFVARVKQQCTVHPYPNVRAELYRALLAHAPSDELIQNVRLQIYDRIPKSNGLLWALAQVPAQHTFLDSLCDADDPVLATAALQALLQSPSNKTGSCPISTSRIERILQRADPGQLALLGSTLRAESGSKNCVVDKEKIKQVMQQLPLPEALEAWIELNEALAVITGEDALPMPELPRHEIQWEALMNAGSQPVVDVHTSKGSIRLILLSEDAPATVSYFLEEIQEDYFNGKAFHRVVPNFVVQTGCPRGDGFGAPDVLLRSEFSPLHYGPGVVGMASAGPDTESSQWFITHRTTPHLDGRYTIFAAVIEGMDVVWQLEEGDVIEGVELNSGL